MTWEERIPDSIAIVAKPVRPMTLCFVDADSGADLAGIRLVPMNSSPAQPLPGQFASPFDLPLFTDLTSIGPGWMGIRQYRVETPGYETMALWVDPREGGTRTFELTPEAVLDVIFRGDPESRTGRELRAQRTGSRDISVSTPLTSDRSLRIDGLSAGAWSVWVTSDGKYDPSFGPPSEIALVAGEARHLEIPSPPLPASVEMVDLRGTLRLPEQVDPRTVRLRFEPGPGQRLDTPGIADVTGDVLARDPKDAGLFHWYAGRVSAGAWRASVLELEWTREITVKRGASIELLADRPPIRNEPGSARAGSIAAPVPQPRVVTPVPLATKRRLVHVVDGQTGAALGPQAVSITAIVRTAQDASRKATWSAVDSTWSVLAADEASSIEVTRVDEPTASRTIELDDSAPVQTITLWPTQFVAVKVYDGDSRIAPPEIEAELPLAVDPVGHVGEAFFFMYSKWPDSELVVPVSGPGRYRFTLRDAPRYAPHEPVEIEVKSGEPPPFVVFRLTRVARPK